MQQNVTEQHKYDQSSVDHLYDLELDLQHNPYNAQTVSLLSSVYKVG